MSHQQHTPASRAEATAQLRALFEAFPVDRKEGIGGAATYLIAVEGYSVNAIHKAVKRLIRGEVAGVDMRFLPTPAQVSAAVRYCEDLIAPVSPRMALPAPDQVEPTDDERQRVADRVRAWVKEREPETNTGFKPREAGDIARELRNGKFTLSPESLRTCVPDPAEQYDEFSSPQTKTEIAA